jgi:hypothetical protein
MLYISVYHKHNYGKVKVAFFRYLIGHRSFLYEICKVCKYKHYTDEGQTGEYYMGEGSLDVYKLAMELKELK